MQLRFPANPTRHQFFVKIILEHETPGKRICVCREFLSLLLRTDMGKYVAENVVKKLIHADIPVKNARVAILGFTFKENCPDPAADAAEAKRLYGIEFVDMNTIGNMDAVILAVAHEQFKGLNVADFDKLYSGNRQKVLIDVKSMLDKKAFNEAGYVYWRL